MAIFPAVIPVGNIGIMCASARRVSIIIPTYHRRKYVVKAIQSVLDQGTSDYEIIVVDDGFAVHGTEIMLVILHECIRFEKTV
jgi:hypothetical protein